MDYIRSYISYDNNHIWYKEKPTKSNDQCTFKVRLMKEHIYDQEALAKLCYDKFNVIHILTISIPKENLNDIRYCTSYIRY